NDLPAEAGGKAGAKKLMGSGGQDTAVFTTPPLFVKVHHQGKNQYLLAGFPRGGNGQQDYLRVWDLTPDGQKVETDYKSFPPQLYSDYISEVKPARSLAFTRGEFDALRFVKLANVDHAEVLRGLDGPAQALAQARNGRWLVAGGQKGQVRAWDLENL